MPFDDATPTAPNPAPLAWAVEQHVHDGLSLAETLERLAGEDPEVVRMEYARLVRDFRLLERLTDCPEDGADAFARLSAPTTAPAHRLGATHLTLAVAQCIRDGHSLPATQDALWREDPREVAAAYLRLQRARDDMAGPGDGGVHGLAAALLQEHHRPLKCRPERRGMTVAEVAARTGIDRETLARLMEHHGYLALVPFGGTQRRRLVTDDAFHAGLGHNVDPSATRVGHLEGEAKAAPFPVFYEERLADMVWTFDLDGIRLAAEERKAGGGKKAALQWLLQRHGYLPNAELAKLTGFSERSVERARAKEMPNAAEPPTTSGDGYLVAWVKAEMPR